MSTQGEGSRGGKIVGHTKSGLPIYASHERRKKLATGSALVVAGSGIGYYSGRKAAHLTIDAAKAENASYNYVKKAGHEEAIGPLFKTNANRYMHAAERSRKIAKDLDHASFRLRNIGSTVASALIGYGVEEGLKGTNLKDDSKTRAAIGVGAGAASYFAIRTGYEHTLSSSKIVDAFSSAVKHVLKRR